MRSAKSGFIPFISVAPHTSTLVSSNNNTMPPARASDSDGIHHTIFGSLSGWLLAFTHVLTSVLESFVSSFILFISVSSDISTTPNAVGIHDPPPPTPPRLFEMDFIAPLHTIYAYLTGLLLTLTGIKYQGSSTNPFSEHPTLMMLFLIAILAYFIALITLTRSNRISDHCSKLMVGVCHISGGVACELLLLVLVSPIRSLIINASSLVLIVTLVLCYKSLLHAQGTEEEGSEMVDIEAATTPTA